MKIYLDSIRHGVRQIAIEIADRRFIFDAYGVQRGGAPMTFGWARNNVRWSTLFPFPDSPDNPDYADDQVVHAAHLHAHIVEWMAEARPEEEPWIPPMRRRI